MKRQIVLLAGLVVLASSAGAQTFTLGETARLGYGDSGNADLLLAQGPYTLSRSASPVSESFWVAQAAGQLRLGIYTAGPNNNCKGGTLVAQTAPFATKANSWNTAPLTSQPMMSPGKYCLAYLPNNNALSFRKGVRNGIGNYWYSFPFGSMPTTYATSNVNGPDGNHWSLYATLTPVSAVQTPLSVKFNPSSGTVSDTAAPGTVLAAVVVQTSDGQVMAGQGLSITTQTISGLASLTSPSLPSNVQVASISTAADGQQAVTVQACENGACVSGTLPVMVSGQPPPPTLSMTVTPPAPSIPYTSSTGTVVATMAANWSDGSAFTGSFQFTSPNNDDGGLFSIAGTELLVNGDVSNLGGTIQHVTVEPVQ